MAISLKHKFQSGKVDGTDTTKVRPSNWNEEHELILATNTLVGRIAPGTGLAEEVACTAAARGILSQSSIADILNYLGVSPATTGDFRLTLKAVAPIGWVMCNDGTIGDALSSATTRANADCEPLYTLIWNNVSNTYAPVSGGRGPNAASDWAAHKRISLTKMLGRAIIVAGNGGGTNFALGQTIGAESIALTTAQMPAHSHGVTDPGHSHNYAYYNPSTTSVGDGIGDWQYVVPGYSTVGTYSAATGISIQSNGSGQAHNNMQPSTAVNIMLKL